MSHLHRCEEKKNSKTFDLTRSTAESIQFKRFSLKSQNHFTEIKSGIKGEDYFYRFKHKNDSILIFENYPQ